MAHSLLLVSHEVVGPVMAGPGIRYYHLARTLAPHVQTTLAIPQESPGQLGREDFAIVRYQTQNLDSLHPLLREADIHLVPSELACRIPQIGDFDAYLIIDGYDPLLAEWLALYARQEPAQLHEAWRERLAHLHEQYRVGDFFLCASERQRDWWLGLLEANGRINPATYQADPSLRSLIDVVAYGLPNAAPSQPREIAARMWSGIETNDHLLVWGGGLWPWLDPVTAIRAVDIVWRQRQDVKLLFPGTKHPNPRMGHLPTEYALANETAETLGLLDRAVFFGDWVPYADWASLLMECDIALTLHYDTLETRLAFRSRVLEYIWAGLPTIASQGDATSELVQYYQLGRVVGYEDPSAVAAAILDLLGQPRNSFDPRFALARQELSWERAAEPLLKFCRNPHRAADRPLKSETIESFYYPSMGEQLRQERERWQALIAAYESGRFMRAMKWVERSKGRFSRLTRSGSGK